MNGLWVSEAHWSSGQTCTWVGSEAEEWSFRCCRSAECWTSTWGKAALRRPFVRTFGRAITLALCRNNMLFHEKLNMSLDGRWVGEERAGECSQGGVW
eukprot:360407-Chlamydomonas_euryale.AAC.6